MKVLFIYSMDDIQSTARPLQTAQQIQFGISYISSFLKKHGHSTMLTVLSRVSGGKNRKIIDRYLKEFSPNMVCFTAVATEYAFIAGIAKYIKQRYPDIYLLAGGVHASLNPDTVILDDFDSICIGEGEMPTLELVSQLEKGIRPSGIANLWIKHGAGIEKNPPRPFLQDLDGLPFPDTDMWMDWIEEQPQQRSSVLLGRGCPFQCSYCCNHSFKRLAPGTYVRYRNPGNIIEEIKEIRAKFPSLKEVYLEVETISTRQQWAIELCSKLTEFNSSLEKPLSFGTNIRITPHADFERLISAFKTANFRFINIGLESGSERVRREVLRRDYSNQDVLNTVKLIKKYGMEICIFNMIGIPGETLVDFQETVKVNRFCAPQRHLTSIFYPYPGTDLYHICQDKGLSNSPPETTLERKKAVLDLPGFSKKQIQKSYIWFEYYVYYGIKPMYKILAKVLRSRLESVYFFNILYRKLTHFRFFKQLKYKLAQS